MEFDNCLKNNLKVWTIGYDDMVIALSPVPIQVHAQFQLIPIYRKYELSINLRGRDCNRNMLWYLAAERPIFSCSSFAANYSVALRSPHTMSMVV